MSSPVLARTDDAGERFYTWKGETFWSVTTLIAGGVPKYGLPLWYGKTVAELVVADIIARGPHARAHAAIRRWAKAGRAEVERRQAIGELTSIKLPKLTTPELALRLLKAEPERVRDEAGDLGIDVHNEAEALVLRLARETGEAWAEGTDMPDWPDELLGHMRSFVAFLDDWRPQYLATEATVFNRPQAYGGTLDAIVRILVPIARDVFLPMPVVLDYKSGRNVHPEVAMQLSAYARGQFIGLPDRVTEVPMPPVDQDQGLVLHLTPKGYKLWLVPIGPDVFDAFRYAREVYRWSKFRAPTVLRRQLIPPPKEVQP